jgi:hypothetical protein
MAQQTASADSVVPSLVKFTGSLSDTEGKHLTGTVGVTFLLYKDQTGGAPLWLETQNVQADKNGHYSVMLGSGTAHGLPPEVFVGGEARWLGVQASGQAEQARTLLFSVPYALKALDAETLGGKPLSAFQLALPQSKNGSTQNSQVPALDQPNEIRCAGSASCKTGFVPLFSSNGGSANVSDSIIRQGGSTVTISGSDNITGNETVAGTLTAMTGDITGQLSVHAQSGNGAAIEASSASSVATVVYGGASSPTGATWGVEGETFSSDPGASGVTGRAHNVGVGVTGLNDGGGTGILGFGNPGYGIYGQHVGASSLSAQIPYAGVWGDTNSQVAAGVAGTGQDGVGGIFLNDSPSGYYSLIAASYDSSGPMFTAENISNGVSCTINPAAHLQCDGGIGAMVQLDSGKRKVAMSGIDSPENWFEDFGSAQLVNGVAVVKFDRDFIQTVNTGKDYRVFPVPNGDCRGLYVTNKAANSFEVHELGGGSSNVSFDYRITAIRRTYEKVRFEDHTNDPDPRKMLEQMRKAKPASSTSPASLKPALPATHAVPVAQLTSK